MCSKSPVVKLLFIYEYLWNCLLLVRLLHSIGQAKASVDWGLPADFSDPDSIVLLSLGAICSLPLCVLCVTCLVSKQYKTYQVEMRSSCQTYYFLVIKNYIYLLIIINLYLWIGIMCSATVEIVVNIKYNTQLSYGLI